MDTISGLIELRKQVKKTMFLYVKDSDEYNMLHEMSVKLKKVYQRSLWRRNI